MKKLLIVFVFLYCNICFSQSFSCVKIYIANPYVNRIDVAKTQMYNMDYVRSHYASYVFSIEENYINSLFDSLMSFTLIRVANDSIDLLIHESAGFGLDMNFEPCIVIDFVRNNKYNINQEVCTFSVNKQGYVYRPFFSKGELFYPNQKFLDFLKLRFLGLFFLIQ